MYLLWQKMDWATFWAIVFFWAFLEEQTKFLGQFFPRRKLCTHFDKKWTGPHFGRFFHNSSGRPEKETRVNHLFMCGQPPEKSILKIEGGSIKLIISLPFLFSFSAQNQGDQIGRFFANL
jgi:hypothetical protein